MFVRTVLIAILTTTCAVGTLGCLRETSKEESLETHRSLSQRLDDLENDWIRFRAKAEGKGELRQELEVMKDEIEEELEKSRKELDRLGDKADADSAKAKRSLEKAISNLRHSIEKAKKDLG